VKGQKKIYQANCPSKQAGVVILTSDKMDLNPKLVRRDKGGHFILIKGATHQKEITIINLYMSKVDALNFIKNTQIDLKTQIDPNIVVVGDFNTHLSSIHRSSRQKNQQILELN
jgi:hypothetical protein